jgi:N-carbamoylputrescine amidase
MYYVLAMTLTGALATPGSAEEAPVHPGLRVAMIQMDVIDGDLEENMRRAEQGIRESAERRADLVCLPEVADFGWLYQNARQDALPIPGKYTDFLSGLAKELNIWISAGCLEKDGDKTYNTAVLIDRQGAIVLKHRKISTLPELTAHLYDPGDAEDIHAVDTEFGRVGITICADNFDIEHPKKVAALGAWLLITPHGFAENTRDLLDNGVAYINHIKKVAKESNLWVIGTNTAISEVAGGAWKGYRHSGASTIAAPTGKAAAIGKFLETELVVFDIPPAPAQSK